MAAVPVTINGVIVDMYGRTIMGPVKIVGEAMRSDVGVGGGPLPGGDGDHIWGGGNVPMPNPPIANVPGAPGYRPPGGDGKPPSIWPGRPEHPIVIPPDQVPPDAQLPPTPPPGTVTPVPPPPGQAGWPTTGIVPPEYVVIQYPGIGPMVVTPPPHAEPAA